MPQFDLEIEIKMTYKISIEVEADNLEQAIEAGKKGSYNPPFNGSITIGKKEFYVGDSEWEWDEDSIEVKSPYGV